MISTLTMAIAAVLGVAFLALWRFLTQKPGPRSLPKPDRKILKQGFSARKIPAGLDAIVIGSGLGGLSPAALMARKGKKVLVLEQHDVVGGCTHTFTEKGYEFDTGLHYVGGVGDKSMPLRKIFDTITDSGLEWASQGEDYDVVHLADNEPFGMCGNLKKLHARLNARFPGEEVAIAKYIKLLNSCEVPAGLFFMLRIMPKWLAALLRPFMAAPFKKLMSKTTHEGLLELTSNKDLIATLEYCYGDMGVSPGECGFGLHLLVANHYSRGGYYPVGGSSEIGLYATQVIQAAGGMVLVRAPVTRIMIEGGRAVGVECKGVQIRAPIVISAAGVFNTYTNLIDEKDRTPLLPMLKDMGDVTSRSPVRSGPGHATLFMGIKDPENTLVNKLPSHNKWIFSSNDHHANCLAHYADTTGELPLSGVFVGFPSAKDPTWNQRFPGRQTVEVLTEMPYSLVKAWKDGRVRHRGDDYEAEKAKFTKRLKAVFFKHFPELEPMIDFEELGSPLSNNFYLNAHQGASYGVHHNTERFFADWLRPKSPIPGLVMSGQDIMTAGIGSAATSGLFALAAADFPMFLSYLYLWV